MAMLSQSLKEYKIYEKNMDPEQIVIVSFISVALPIHLDTLQFEIITGMHPVTAVR